jgi:hypothetical protein
MRRALSSGFVIVAAAVLAACGSKSNGAGAGKGDASTGDDATEDAGDGGAEGASGTYPAFTVDAPQVQKNQGAVLTSPVIVTITWPDDPDPSTWEAFGDAIGGSAYWSATTAPYGVGAATSGAANHVRMTQPLPSPISLEDVLNLATAAIAGQPGTDGGAGGADGGAPNPPWPAPVVSSSGQAQTIYALYFGPSTVVTDPGTGTSLCGLGGFGFHDELMVGSVGVAYAVTLECPAITLADNEETAAHELVEAATDPYVEGSTLGYVHFDDAHFAWEVYTQFNDELADACQNWQDSYYQESGSFPYWVQRSWSNTAALAGHSPCVPAAAGPYHGMTLVPSQESSVKVDASAVGGPTSVTTKGFKATVGQPLTFQVGYFSDASDAPWKIAYDFPATLSDTFGDTTSNGKATVSIDQTTGQNGDTANVTVTVTAKGGSGFHVMAITWDPPTSKDFLPHYLPLLIVDE